MTKEEILSCTKCGASVSRGDGHKCKVLSISQLPSKQEEIREEVGKYISLAYWYEGEKNIVEGLTSGLIGKLVKKGLVLKVDRELPSVKDLPFPYVRKQEQDRMLKAGYVKTESLI